MSKRLKNFRCRNGPLSLERETLLATYAEHLASGRPKAGPVGYDPTVERERLAFEREKWEAE